MPISRCLDMARASVMLATFAQALSKTSTNATMIGNNATMIRGFRGISDASEYR